MKFSEYETTAKKYKIGSGKGFWSPSSGDNQIKILSGYEAYGNHWVKEDNRSYICIGKENGCKYCENGNKPSVKFLMWIIDRKTGDVRLAQVGYSVIEKLGILAVNKDWAFEDIPEYDIVINKAGEKLNTKYSVTPTRLSTPLTKEEQELVDEQVKDIKEIINKMKEKVGGMPEEEEEDVNESEINVEEIPF